MIRSSLAYLIFLVLFSGQLPGQAVSFYASTNARQIVVGSFFEVTFTLENAKPDSYEAPSLEDFILVSGPNRSSQMSIINGRVSQKQSFGYTLTAEKEGKYTIGAAKVIVAGRTYRSDPLQIEVVKAATKEELSGVQQADYFIRTEVSAEEAYIGQQITLKYRLFTTKDVRSYNFTSLPAFDGFFAQEIQNYSERSERVVIDGIQYVSRGLKAISLYPQQKGTFQIEPANINLGVATSGSRTSFFFNTNLKPVRIKSEKLTIQINELPEDAPISFSGAVGTFVFDASIDKRSLKSDNAVSLTLQIRGNGDNKFIQAPVQPFTEYFEIYEPNLLKEQTQVSRDEIQVIKTYEYLLLPKRSGKIAFTPEFAYFNPDSSRYITLKSREFIVDVLESTSRDMATFGENEKPLPPIFTSTRLKEKNRQFLYSTPYWMANGAIVLGFLGLLMAKRIQTHRAKLDPKVIRHRRARKTALKSLNSARQYLEKNQVTEFYIQLRKALMEYLAAKTSQPSAQLTKEDIHHVLAQSGVDDYYDEVISLIEKGEQAIYGPKIPSEAGQVYNKALNLLENLESAFKK